MRHLVTLALLLTLFEVGTEVAFAVADKLVTGTGVRDWRVTVGAGENMQTLRLIQVRYRGKWYRYLTVTAQAFPISNASQMHILCP